MRDDHDALFRRARSGDATAKEEVVRLLQPLARSHADRCLGATPRRWVESGDIAQQALFEALEHLERLPPEAGVDSLEAILRKRIEWRVRDVVRNNRRHAGESALGAPLDKVAPADPHGIGIVTGADERRFIEELVRRLPDGYAAVVRCCGLEGMSYAEAARHLEMSDDTVRDRYLWARDRIARAVKRREAQGGS